MLRQRIAQAFGDLDKALEGNKDNLKEFRAIVPSMQIVLNTGEELDIIANDMAGKIANETEQALLWAQRIDNGEGWQEVLSTLYIGGCGKRLLRNDDGRLRVYTNLFDEPYTLTEESLTTALPLIVTY